MKRRRPAVAGSLDAQIHDGFVRSRYAPGEIGGLYYNRSLDFDGANDCVTCGDNYDFDITDDFTLSAWYKTNGAGEYTLVSKRQGADQRGFEMRLDLNGASDYIFGMFYHDNAPANAIVTYATKGKGVYNDGAWHHAVVTFTHGSPPDQAGSLIFWDGTAVKSGNTSNNLTGTISNTGDLIFGGVFNPAAPTYPMLGRIDDVTIWPVAFTLAEAQELYNGGDPLDPRLHSQWQDGCGWWRMGDVDTYPRILDYGAGHNGTMTNMSAGDIVVDSP